MSAANQVAIAKSRLAAAVRFGNRDKENEARRLLAIAKAKQHFEDFNLIEASGDNSAQAFRAMRHHYTQGMALVASLNLSNGFDEDEVLREQLRHEFAAALADCGLGDD